MGAGHPPVEARRRSVVAADSRTGSRRPPMPSCRLARSVTRPSMKTGDSPASSRTGLRVDLVRHQAEHEQHPVGDDDWLESLRRGDTHPVGRWSAPFDVVRRYLVTGQVQAGRGRALAHDAIVNAMTQIRRWGTDGDRPGRSARLGCGPCRRDPAHGAVRGQPRPPVSCAPIIGPPLPNALMDLASRPDPRIPALQASPGQPRQWRLHHRIGSELLAVVGHHDPPAA